MELILIQNCSILYLHCNDMNSFKSVFLKRKKKVRAINILLQKKKKKEKKKSRRVSEPDELFIFILRVNMYTALVCRSLYTLQI